MLIQEHDVDAYCFKGISYDCGDKFGYLRAIIKYSLRHPALGKEFSSYFIQRAIQQRITLNLS